MRTPARRAGRPVLPGFTLLELVVVLAVLAVAATLAVPALTRRAEHRGSPLAGLLVGAREAAARRGETVRLTIGESGGWRIEGRGERDNVIDSGEVERFAGLPVTLLVSPVGSCGFDARSAAAGADSLIPLDPLTCTLVE